MKKYILDMSQAAINRTAMYTISLDTLDGLAARFVGTQYFGQPFKAMLKPEDTTGIDGSLLGPMLSDPDGFAALPRKRTGPLARYPRLFLDPLYVLFDDLTSNDHVMVLDLSTVTSPAWHSPAVARAYEHAFDKISAVRPRVSAISRNSAETLIVNYAFPPDLVDVVPLYVPASRGRNFGSPPSYTPLPCREPFVLFVGSLEVRKNLIGAIKAFDLSNLGEQGYTLLIVGGHGHQADVILRYAQSVRGVKFAGFLSDEELRACYDKAVAFLYPSYLEGFGVPLLEAMAHGVPCIASNTGACPEVGGELVHYRDPDDHKGFAADLVAAVQQTREERSRFALRAGGWIAAHYKLDSYLETLDHNLSK